MKLLHDVRNAWKDSRRDLRVIFIFSLLVLTFIYILRLWPERWRLGEETGDFISNILFAYVTAFSFYMITDVVKEHEDARNFLHHEETLGKSILEVFGAYMNSIFQIENSPLNEISGYYDEPTNAAIYSAVNALYDQRESIMPDEVKRSNGMLLSLNVTYSRISSKIKRHDHNMIHFRADFVDAIHNLRDCIETDAILDPFRENYQDQVYEAIDRLHQLVISVIVLTPFENETGYARAIDIGDASTEWMHKLQKSTEQMKLNLKWPKAES